MDTGNFVNKFLRTTSSATGKLQMLQKLADNCNLDDLTPATFREFLSLDNLPITEMISDQAHDSRGRGDTTPPRPNRKSLRAIWESSQGAATIVDGLFTMPMPENEFHEFVARALTIYAVSDGLNATYQLIRVFNVLTSYNEDHHSSFDVAKGISYLLQFRQKIHSIRDRNDFKQVFELTDSEIDELTSKAADEIKQRFSDYFHDGRYWLPLYKPLLTDMLCARFNEMVPIRELRDVRWEFVSSMLSIDTQSDAGRPAKNSSQPISADSYFAVRESMLTILARLEQNGDPSAEPVFTREEHKQLERAAGFLKALRPES
jgi:hypothetical protein